MPACRSGALLGNTPTRIHLVLVGLQNRIRGPYLAATQDSHYPSLCSLSCQVTTSTWQQPNRHCWRDKSSFTSGLIEGCAPGFQPHCLTSMPRCTSWDVVRALRFIVSTWTVDASSPARNLHAKHATHLTSQKRVPGLDEPAVAQDAAQILLLRMP
jgi:hypothetical protein